MDNFRSLFLLTKPFGFCVRSFHQSSGGQIATSGLSRSGTALFLINVSAFLYLASRNHSLAPESTYLDSGSTLLDVGGHLMLQTSYLTMVVALIGRASRQRLMGKVLNGFVQVDRKIKLELGVSVDYGREWRLTVGLLGVFLGLVVVATGFGVYCLYLLDSLADGMIFYGGQILISISGVVLSTNTLSMMVLLYRRVCLVQRCLENILNFNPRPTISKLILFKAKERIRPAEALHRKISTVALIYDDLYQLSRKQSSLIWTEITSYLGIVITYGILTLFATYRAIRTGHFESIVASSIYLAWWAEYCLGALVILGMGHMLELATRRMENVLCIAAERVRPGLEEVKVRSFMLQISNMSPKISTWFFDVNLRVFFNMLGTMATFLFMMVQFDD